MTVEIGMVNQEGGESSVLGHDAKGPVHIVGRDGLMPVLNPLPVVGETGGGSEEEIDDLPKKESYGVFISQLIRYARCCKYFKHFVERSKLLITKLNMMMPSR